MNTASKKNDAREKAKLAAVPVLLLVFVYVLYGQFASEEESPADTGGVVASNVAVASPVSMTATPANTQPVGSRESVSSIITLPLSEREWYESPLDQILQHDPFRKTDQLKSDSEKRAENPSPLTAETVVAVDAQQQVKERLGGVATKILIKSDKGSAAYVGARLVREGDLWEEGMQVRSIDLNGVVVAPPQEKDENAGPTANSSPVGDKLRSFFPMLAPPPKQ